MSRQLRLTAMQIQSRIDSAYHMAEVRKDELHTINQNLRDLWDELNSRTESGKRRYSHEEYGYASGYSRALWNALMREKVEFVYRMDKDVPEIGAKKGDIFSTHKASTHRLTEEFYAAGLGIRLNDAWHTHVWLGTDKPISAWEPPRGSNLPQSGKTPGTPLYKAA